LCHSLQPQQKTQLFLPHLPFSPNFIGHMNQNLSQILSSPANSFHIPLNFDPKTQFLCPIDLSQNNADLTETIIQDANSMSVYINQLLMNSGCIFAYGGYQEQRRLYTRSAHFGTGSTEEPRTLHLGIDFWGSAKTPVLAAYGGFVHSKAINNGFGDYGGTIVLQHQINGHIFHTLYGHLSHQSVHQIATGSYVSIGEPIGQLGYAYENGNWSPHLHFQIIEDMDNKIGDYPGVCKMSEKEKYLANCPNPDLMFQLDQYKH
jgi:peptidoglycan LD-endopeptidase LytH